MSLRLGLLVLVLLTLSNAFTSQIPNTTALSPEKGQRSFMLGLSFNFINTLKRLSEREVSQLRQSLHRNDILLLPIAKMATPQEIDEVVSYVADKFPDQRLYIFPYTSRASLMFESQKWSNIPAAAPIRGVLDSTIAKLDGILIDHEIASYCHTLDETESAVPDNVEFNKIICSNPEFPRMASREWITSSKKSIAFLNPLIARTKNKVRAALERSRLPNKKFTVGLVPSGIGILLDEHWSNPKFLTAVNGDAQILQTQMSCKTSPEAFEKTAKKIDEEYRDEALRLAQVKQPARHIFRSNIGMQISVGSNEDVAKYSSSAMVTIDRAVQCLRRINDYKIGTVLLFHMRTEYMLETMKRLNSFRTY